jgi:Metallo-beta-lactamase superfamily
VTGLRVSAGINYAVPMNGRPAFYANDKSLDAHDRLLVRVDYAALGAPIQHGCGERTLDLQLPFLGMAAPFAHAQFGAEPAKLELIKVRDDIYVISNVAVPGQSTALITNEGVLLVDNKFEIDHDDILKMLKTVTNQPGQPNITFSEHSSIHLGGKTVELYKVGRAHTNGDIVVLFPEQRVLASGDIFANGSGTSAELVDYAGGGSAKEWPKAVEQALTLDFDTVIPGHGLVSTRKDLEAYHDKTIRFRDTLTQLVKQGKSKADIEAVVRGQFDWEDFHVQSALDGLINEFR